jgi:hypothetical protein
MKACLLVHRVPGLPLPKLKTSNNFFFLIFKERLKANKKYNPSYENTVLL